MDRSSQSRTATVCSLLACLLLQVNLSVACAAAIERRQLEFTFAEGTGMSPAVSPDGRTIAVDLHGTLWVLPSTGGQARAITDRLDEVRLPVWSPDGKHIAYQTYTADNWHVAIMSANGTEQKQVTFGSYDDREPNWHPDGKRIVFASDRSGNYDLWEANVATGEVLKFISSVEDDGYPAWSPDGHSLVFMRSYAESAESRAPSKSAICIRDSDGTIRTLFETDELSLATPSWSPDGKRILFHGSGRMRSGIWETDVTGKIPELLTSAHEDVFLSRLSWLPDGKLLYPADGKLKLKSDAGSDAEIIEFEATFSIERHKYARKNAGFRSDVPRPVLGIFHPVVSPDGTRVAFAALSDIWILHVGNPVPTRVTDDSFVDIDPTWSPDGRKLAYSSDRGDPGTMSLWVYDLETSASNQLASTEESISLPSWSPDGERIAFYVSEASDWHARYLHELDIASGEIQKKYHWLFKPGRPSWSPDQETIAISAQRELSGRFRKGLNEILLVSLDDGSSQFVTPVPDRSLGMRGANGPAWSPDGRHFAYVYNGLLWVAPIGANGDLLGPGRRLTSELADSPSWVGDSGSLVYLAVDRLKRVYLDDGRVEDIPLDLTWVPDKPGSRIVVQAGRLFDSTSNEYQKDVDILIEGNEIAEIVPRRKRWRRATVIDATDKTVIPGLWENHIHQFAVNGEVTGRMHLANGVTSVREVGADPYEALEAKEAWASGARKGPRQFYSALLEGARVWYGMSLPIESGAMLDQELDRAKRLDYDLIKTYERLNDRSLKRVIDFAHENGIPVTSHELYPAVALGVDAVEHLGTRDRLSYRDRLSFKSRAYDDVRRLMSETGLVTVPTMWWGRATVLHFERGWSPVGVRQFGALAPERFHKVVDMSGIPRTRVDLIKEGLAARGDIVRGVVESGGRMIPGTDTSFYMSGLSLLMEIVEFVNAGVAPHTALQSATIWSAELAGIADDLGTIEEGKLADLVIIDGDPLNNIEDLLKVDTAIKNGTVHRIDDLLANP